MDTVILSQHIADGNHSMPACLTVSHCRRCRLSRTHVRPLVVPSRPAVPALTIDRRLRCAKTFPMISTDSSSFQLHAIWSSVSHQPQVSAADEKKREYEHANTTSRCKSEGFYEDCVTHTSNGKHGRHAKKFARCTANTGIS